MTLKCLIIDDEPLARKVISEYIGDTSFLELAGEAEDPLKSMALLTQRKVDLIFLDIHMPKVSGLTFLRSNKDLPPVILTTAFPEYALEGYELDIIDYLVKPVLYERFFKAASKAKEFIELSQRSTSNVSKGTYNYIFIKCDGKLEKIFFEDIIYVEAMSNYVIFHTLARKYIAYLTIRNVSEQLPADQFIQIYRSYIVALHKISRIEGNDLWIGTYKLPISKNFKEQLMTNLESRIAKR